MAEILGRIDGYQGGRAGTFHVAAPDIGILHTSTIVGGCLPLAAGTAFARKRLGGDRVTVVFFGDGTMEEGAIRATSIEMLRPRSGVGYRSAADDAGGLEREACV